MVDNPLCDIVEHQITRQFSALGIAGLNYNGSICDNMARFLDNGPDTEAYDWRDALQNLDGFFDAINTYGKVNYLLNRACPGSAFGCTSELLYDFHPGVVS